MSISLRNLTAATLAALFGSTVGATGLPDWVTFDDPTGVMKAGGLGSFELVHFGPGWQGAGQSGLRPAPGYPAATEPGGRKFAGTMLSGGARIPMQIEIEVNPAGSGSISWSGRIRPEEPVESESLSLQLSLKPLKDKAAFRLLINGRPLNLPAEPGRSVLHDAPARTLDIAGSHGTLRISGNFTLFIQDARQGGGLATIRLVPLNFTREVFSWKLRLDFEWISAGDYSGALTLGNAANRSTSSRNPIAGADLRWFRPGEFSLDAVPVSVTAGDDRRNLMVLSGDAHNMLPETLALRPPHPGSKCRYLYLLHTALKYPGANQPVGSLFLTYADGRTRELPVTAGIDCGNYETPAAAPNANLLLRGPEAADRPGFFLSCFAIDEIPARIEFSAARNTVWAIAGGTFDGRLAEIHVPKTYTDSVGERWLAAEFSGEFRPGTPLDFSRYADAPAGKHGRITANAAGHLVFENAPDRRIRLNGINLCGFACFLTREEADRLADQFLRLGYNSVRLHHIDDPLGGTGSQNSTEINPERFDQLAYLVSALKKRGIYITIDLYCSRRTFKPGELPERFQAKEYKGAITIDPDVQENFKQFARNLLTRPNPYTGYAFGEDPVLFAVNLVNENDLIQRYNATPGLEARFTTRFENHLKAEKLLPVPAGCTRDGLFIDFLNQVQRRSIAEQIRFIREELGMKFLITDLNFPGHATQAGNRAMLDLVDSHEYWDHPHFAGAAWTAPIRHHNGSALKAHARYMRWLMPRRIFGKPHIVTEFNYCQPNPYRHELAGMLGAYAALQDWDGLWRFCWVESYNKLKKTAPPWGFEILYDPQAQLSELILFALFGRGDVRAAEPAFAFRFDPDWVRSLSGKPAAVGYYPEDFGQLGLFGRIGTITPDTPFPDLPAFEAWKPQWQQQLPQAVREALQAQWITAATGEIQLNSEDGSLKVITPRSEVLTLAGSELSGKVLEVNQADQTQSVALIALDDRPLPQSAHLLLIHLVDVSAEGRSFQDEERRSLSSYGRLPLLLRRAAAEVALNLPGAYTVTRLKLDGSPAGEVPSRYENGRLNFRIDTAGTPGGVMAYELKASE